LSSLLISPKELKQRVLKIWQRGDLYRAWLQNQSYFPLEIPLKKIAAQTLLNQYSELQDAIILLRQDAKKQGYIITDKQVSHRQLGEQKIPALITFNSETIFLDYVAKTRDFLQFQTLAQQSLQQQPQLSEWLIRYPFKMMKFAKVWQQLLTVCAYFKEHPQIDCYLRQLDIEGVDSKFIEQHKAILNELLPQILDERAYQAEITGLSQHGFERRYGLRYDLPLIRFRILDASLAIHGLTDLSLPVNEFRQLRLEAQTIFIVENKISGLAFPDYPKALVIFGLGYAVNLLAQAQCLQNCTIYYWGDIDTHGFAILSRLRHHYPQVKSLLMDNETFEKFAYLTVKEPIETAEKKALSHLNLEENFLYQQLQQHLLRLEQERLSFAYLQHYLLAL
jgi:hypothetical protein